MKKQWFEPKIVEIAVRMTAADPTQVKTHGTGDSLAMDDLSPWQDCDDCCS